MATRMVRAALRQPMAGLRVEVEPVNLLQLRDFPESRGAERRLPLERVEQDSFEQIAERQVQEIGEGLRHLEDLLLEPDSRLDALDRPSRGRFSAAALL